MIRLQRTVVWVVVLGLALGAANVVFADGESDMRRGGRRQSPSSHVAAFAALEPVGTVSGWGRIVVRDDFRDSGQERSVNTWVFGLEPNASFEVEAEGVVIGTVDTDRYGDGSLQLRTGDGKDFDVPSGLPPAGDMVTAIVLDASLAVVLEGTFSTVRQLEGDEVVFENKTELVDVSGGSSTGMACVRVMESEAQELISRASRLEPGTSYSVVVDGVPAGVVTADAEGQAALELEFPSELNPLPEELLPVTEVYLVEWYQGDSLVLTGAFEEKPECERLEGTVAELSDDGFVLVVGDHRVHVVVTVRTHFKEFEGLEQLEEGDAVILEGCFSGDLFIAEWVWLIDDEPECDEIRGTVVEVGVDEFVMAIGDDRIVVEVTYETRLKEFGSLKQLGEGDVVVVEGCFEGDVLVAFWVLLVEDADGPECAELRGTVVEVGVDEFVMAVGDDRLVVEVTYETRLKEFESLEQLGEGDVVVVEGCFEGDVLVAFWVLLVEDADAPECVELHGTVAEVGVDEFVIVVGDDRIVVEVTDETRLKEFESLEQLGEGDVVVVEGCFEGELLVAYWVLLVEDADAPDWWEADGTVGEIFEDGFILLADGEEIRVYVGDGTEFKEVEGLDGLGTGDVVFVEGPCDGESMEAVLVMLIESAA